MRKCLVVAAGSRIKEASPPKRPRRRGPHAARCRGEPWLRVPFKGAEGFNTILIRYIRGAVMDASVKIRR